jgi:hypothetical protein
MQQTAQTLHDTLEKAREEGAHLLLPSTHISELPPYHKIVIDRVFLSPEADDGDVYLQQSGSKYSPARYAPTRQGLMKLANAAGVMWDPARCVRLDDRRDRDYVAYQAVGGIKKIDGSPLFFKAEYDLDFEVVEEEIRENYEVKARKYNDDHGLGWWHRMNEDTQKEYIEKCIRRDLLQKRKHRAKLAETGAMTRVVRALLGLKSSYTSEELKKPFIVVRTVFQPDYSDPETKKQIAMASIQAVSGVFGTAKRQPQLRLIEPVSENVDSFPEDYTTGNDEDFVSEEIATEEHLIESVGEEVEAEEGGSSVLTNTSFRDEFINLQAAGFSTWYFKNIDRIKAFSEDIQGEIIVKWNRLYPNTECPLKTAEDKNIQPTATVITCPKDNKPKVIESCKKGCKEQDKCQPYQEYVFENTEG